MKDTLKPGDRHVFRYTVPRERTVPFLYPDSPDFVEMPEVFATGYMVGLMEWACIDHLRAHLDPGEGSLGTLIEVSHTAATPPGLTVMVSVECETVDRRKVTWRVSAHDGVDTIGEGRIGRTLVQWQKFNQRLGEKIWFFDASSGWEEVG
ncbi:MAG: thioesterase [Azospirillum sp.]|nr:thioesterase [Azospirillum sp.]